MSPPHNYSTHSRNRSRLPERLDEQIVESILFWPVKEEFEEFVFRTTLGHGVALGAFRIGCRIPSYIPLFTILGAKS